MDKNWIVIARITRAQGSDLTIGVKGQATTIYEALGNAKGIIAMTYPDYTSIYIMSAVQDGETDDEWKVFSRK